MPNYRKYPTDLEQPKRDARKHLRKIIFYENKYMSRVAKKAAKVAKQKAKEEKQ